MLKKLLLKDKFPTKLFIAVSIGNFIVLILFILIVSSLLGGKPSGQASDISNDRLFLKEDFNYGDDYGTNIPQLSDILNGPIISERDPILGDFDSPVAMVIYSDFECQYCQEQERVFKRIIQEYPSQTQLIWKDYPIQKEDSYSWKAAKAARCAQEQEKFWEYHDLLYASIDDQSEEKYFSLAEELNLKKNKFKDCFYDREIENLIKENIAEAQALDIIGIPLIYINDQEIMGNINYEDLKKEIDSQIEKNI